MRTVPVIAAVVAAGVLMAARPASACETDSPSPGLEIFLNDGMKVAEGGVLTMRAVAFTVDVEAALQDLSLWEVRHDDEIQTGKFEVAALWDSTATSVDGELHVFALTWRPDAPFTAGGVYTVDYATARYPEQAQRVPLEVVPAQPAPALDVVVQPTTVISGGSEVVCCETYLDSCGGDSLCEPTHGTVLPAIDLDVELPGGTGSQWIVWVARALPGGGLGPPLQAQYAVRTGPEYWYGMVTFDVPAEQYCVVVGLTNVGDGSETLSQPYCVDKAEVGVPGEGDVPLSERMQPYDEANPADGRCVGPLVYEADGAAYPREDVVPEASKGCSVAPRGGSLALLLLLALIRRRRARA